MRLGQAPAIARLGHFSAQGVLLSFVWGVSLRTQRRPSADSSTALPPYRPCPGRDSFVCCGDRQARRHMRPSGMREASHGAVTGLGGRARLASHLPLFNSQSCQAIRTTRVLVVHPNAPLSPQGRFRLVRLICRRRLAGRPRAERHAGLADHRLPVGGRYQQASRAGLVDRSSRPRRMPRLTPAPVVRQGGAPAHHASVGTGPDRRPAGPCRLHRPPRPDPSSVVTAWSGPTGRLGCRCAAMSIRSPGGLVHIDVKKLGNIPQGGGHRVHGRQLGKHHSQAD